MWRLVLYSCLIVLWTLWEVGEAPAEQGNAMRALTLQRAARPAGSAPEGTLLVQVFDAYLYFSSGSFLLLMVLVRICTPRARPMRGRPSKNTGRS